MTGGKYSGVGGTKKRARTAWRGFTVMELLVVVVIFGIGSLAISATYINFTRLHRRAANAELLGEEMRFAMELIVRAVRNNRVSYDPNPLNYQMTSIQLVDRDANPIVIGRADDESAVCAGLDANCLALYNGVQWAPITGKNVNIKQFYTYVTPLADPFDVVGGGVYGQYANDQQPRITFVIDAEYVGANERETASMSIQTTVSSRVYVR